MTKRGIIASIFLLVSACLNCVLALKPAGICTGLSLIKRSRAVCIATRTNKVIPPRINAVSSSPFSSKESITQPIKRLTNIPEISDTISFFAVNTPRLSSSTRFISQVD